VNFGRIKKNAPKERKMRPNGKISPNLVTLTGVDFVKPFRPKFAN
jgi:hypothetical protein